MKVKIFTDEGDAPKLEKEINAWLDEGKAEDIYHIKQSYFYDSKDNVYAGTISIWYKEKAAVNLNNLI